MPAPSKMPKNSFLVNAKKIKVSKERGRKDFGDIEELSLSIKKNGLLHPLVVTNIKDERYEYILIAGERRFKAMLIAGFDEMPCSAFNDLGETEQKELELEENVRRKNLEWSEECSILHELDELKKRIAAGQDRTWNIGDTAKIVGSTEGTVKRKIALAKAFEKRPDLKKELSSLPMNVASKKLKQVLEKEKMQRLHERGELELSNDLRLGSCLDLIKDIPDESVDLILTDPPFGQTDIELLREDIDPNFKGKTYHAELGDSDNLNAEGLEVLLYGLIPQLNRVLKPGGHFYFFFAFESYCMLKVQLSTCFTLEQTPLIWDKKRSVTVFKGYDYMTCYEPIQFGYKPPRTRRLSQPELKILRCDIIHAKDKFHPFEKPQGLLKLLIKQSTNLGDTILDPFAGSGSTLLAAKELGRTGIGFEVNEDNYLRAQARLGELV